jgi:putative transposase
MKRSRFSEEQIIAMLKEQEAGMSTADACRKHGVSTATFYKFKARYGGLEVSEARRLKALEDENGKLKKLLAVAMLDNAILKDVAAKNGSARRQAGSGGPRRRDARGEPAPGVPGAGCGPVERALSKPAPRRCRGEGRDEGHRSGTALPSVRRAGDPVRDRPPREEDTGDSCRAGCVGGDRGPGGRDARRHRS